MQTIQAKTRKVYELYRPKGLAKPTPTCWRGLFMAQRLVDLLTYEGYEAECCKVRVGPQGHHCVKVTKGSQVITADPSIAQFYPSAGYLCREGHPEELYNV